MAATTFGPVFILDQSAWGKRDFSAQRQTAQNRIQVRNGLRGDRKRSRKSPPTAGSLAVSGKSASSEDCVVGLGGLEPPTRLLLTAPSARTGATHMQPALKTPFASADNLLKLRNLFSEASLNSLPCGEGLGVGVVVILFGMSSSIQAIFQSGTRWLLASLRVA